MHFVRPLIAPDGKTIYAIGTHYLGEAMAYDTTLARFVVQLEQRAAEWISYSRNGNEMAYVSYPDGSLWLRPGDGAAPKRLTPASMVAIASAWSPDGSTIAFEAKLSDRTSIHLVDVKGANEVRPLTGLARREWSPTWSPDGRAVAFSTDDGIRIVDLATGGESALEAGAKMAFPNWSQDGRYLAAVDGERIMRYTFETQQWDELARVAGAWYPRWSTNATELYVATHDLGVFAVRTADGQVELRASARQEPSLIGVAGRWIGITPDGWPMYLRDVRLQHIYALDWQS